MVEQTSTPQRRPLNGALYSIASDYAYCAWALEERMLKTRTNTTAPGIIMCLTFSIEMMLKCILIIDEDELRTKEDVEEIGIDLRGHNYLGLFERIKPQYQQVILKHFEKLEPTVNSLESLKSLLNEVGSDPFVLWRYVYEKDKPPLFHLRAYKNFGGSLRDAILEMKPGLAGESFTGRK